MFQFCILIFHTAFLQGGNQASSVWYALKKVFWNIKLLQFNVFGNSCSLILSLLQISEVAVIIKCVFFIRTNGGQMHVGQFDALFALFVSLVIAPSRQV